MPAPYEVLAGPFTIYIAAVGTAFTDVTVSSPSGSWTKLGTTGTDNYDDSGVTVSLTPTYKDFTPAGSTAPTKVWRVTEAIEVSFNLVDMSMAQFAKLMNGVTQTDTSATASFGAQSSSPLLMGTGVSLFALMARALSPTSDALASQFQLPIVYQAGQPKIVGKLGDPMKLEAKWTALKSTSLGFGKYIVQTSAL